VSRGDQIDERLTLARYKRLILLGKVTLPLAEARRIVGPDCAYHLYFRHVSDNAGGEDEPKGRAKQRRPGRRHK
jgi:hypothetical protein